MANNISIRLDTAKLDRLIKSVPNETAELIEETAYGVETKAKVSIQSGSKTGRVYIRNGRSHRASAPGEAPATDTGALVNSIRALKRNRFLYRVNVGQLYGVYLEFGTSRMAPRPFLTPAVEKERKDFMKALRDLI